MYKELIENLRDAEKFTRRKASMKLRREAADAIEALQKKPKLNEIMQGLASAAKSQQKRVKVQTKTTPQDPDWGEVKQCKGKTARGTRCRRWIRFFDYCPDHHNQGRNA